MTPHNEAQKGDYAETVLLPGDPLRAKWIAERFLDDAVCVNRVRNCLGFTGTWKGRRVSVQATGMGQPSTAIYVHELLEVYGARTLVRVGTCGGLNRTVKIRDLVIAAAASTDSAIVREGFGAYNYAPAADFRLLRRAADAAEAEGLPAHVGGILSSDLFYQPGGVEAYAPLIAQGVLGVEMEAATLYMLAARFGAAALAICTMTDCLLTGAQIDAAARQTSLEQMVTLGLDVATQE